MFRPKHTIIHEDERNESSILIDDSSIKHASPELLPDLLTT
jgi:hypothetical protein